MEMGSLQFETPVNTVKNGQEADTERQKTNGKFNKTIYSGIYMKLGERKEAKRILLWMMDD